MDDESSAAAGGPDERLNDLIALLRHGDRNEKLWATAELKSYGAAAYPARDALLAVAREATDDAELFDAALDAVGRITTVWAGRSVDAMERLMRLTDPAAVRVEGTDEDSDDPLGQAAFRFGLVFLAGALYLSDAIVDGLGWPALVGAVAGSAAGTLAGARIVPTDRAAASWAAYILGGAAGALGLIFVMTGIGAVDPGRRASSLGIFGAIVGCGVRMIVRGRRAGATNGASTTEAL